MTELRTQPRWGWWLATGLVICIVATGLRIGLPIYRRNVALATLDRFELRIIKGIRRPEWLSKYDRWGWTNGLDSVDAVYDWHYTRDLATRLSESEIDALVSQIRVFGELKRLDLCGSGSKNQHLSILESFPNLEKLDLESTSITDDGLKYLGSSISLRELSLTNTRIDDVGLAHIALLTKIQALRLDRTRISNAGLKHLARLPNLRELTVSNTAVTDAGLDELLKTHPTLSVSDD